MGYNPDLEWPFDLEAAKSTFSTEGYEDGLAIHMNTWNREAWIRRAEVYQQQLAPLNITMEIAALEGIDWRASATSNEGYDIALWGEDTYVDPSGMERFMTSAGAGNWMGFNLPEVDALFQQGLSELDPARRDELYQEAARLFYEAAYVVPIYKEVSPLAKARKLQWGTREFRYYDHASWWLQS
jgi:peptide/nickel transport system substrate-binding protein